MTKIRIVDNVVKYHLVDNPYYFIPINVNSELNVEGLFEKITTIIPNLKNYYQYSYSIVVNILLGIELEVKNLKSQVEEGVNEIIWTKTQYNILSKILCFVS